MKSSLKVILPAQLRHFKKIETALVNKDFETAELLMKQLIEDTQKGIED